MPLYEYRCTACRERFEILQRLGENGDGLACPHCGGRELAKQISTFAAASAGAEGRSGESKSPAMGCGTGCGCAAAS